MVIQIEIPRTLLRTSVTYSSSGGLGWEKCVCLQTRKPKIANLKVQTKQCEEDSIEVTKEKYKDSETTSIQVTATQIN